MESLTRKSQLLEVELERTTKQLKEAISIAGEETAKCKAAKEVIKSLTAQVGLLTVHAFNFTVHAYNFVFYVPHVSLLGLISILAFRIIKAFEKRLYIPY